jgi:predicted enzyme related to lactoylglutathione lyase
MKEITLGNVMIDCAAGEGLCLFYHRLLGWKREVLYGCHAVRSQSGVTFLFMGEEDYVPPVWPEEEGRQQKQMHFDFRVLDVAAAVARARALGAVAAKAQFGGEDFVTMLDPAGHPFCLCRQEALETDNSQNA